MDIKTQVEQANEGFLAKLETKIKDLLNGDAALKATVKELTDKIAGLETAAATHAKAITDLKSAHATEIADLKAAHATALTAAQNTAQAQLAKTGHAAVKTEATADSTAGTKRDRYNALLASGDSKSAGEFYSVNKEDILSGK